MAKVLVVDDEADMRSALAKVLRSAAHEVFEASTSETGLQSVEEHAPDLVLLDIRMAGLDSGIRVLARLRETHKALPVIAVTGYGSEESDLELLSHGARRVLRKPFDNQKLLELVLACLPS